MYLRDLQHSSFNGSETQLDAKTIAALQPAWTYSAGAKLASGVTAVGGTLYFGDWSGGFHAVDARTGSALWQTFLGVAPASADPACSGSLGVSSQATVEGDTVYAGGGDSAVYALDRLTGSQIWRVPLADPATGAYLWSSVVPYGNALYIGVSSLGDCPIVRGALARIDTRNPQQPLVRYMVPEGETGGGIWSTPAIDPDANELFVTTANGDRQDPGAGFWDGAIMRLDPATLETKSYYLFPESDTLTDLAGGSSPTLFTAPDGTPMLAVSQKNGILYAVRRGDASLVWQTRLAISCVNPVEGCGAISTPSFDGKTLFAAGGVRDPNDLPIGSVYAINPGDGSMIWERDTEGAVVAPTTVANGLLFVSTTLGMEIYDTATGQTVWSDNKRGTIFSQPVIANGTIYATYLNGDLVAWALPPISAGTLYSYSAASELPSVAPGAIASAFGDGLTGASIIVTDSTGTSRPARVLESFARQVNYTIPEGTAAGKATVTATTASGASLAGAVQVSPVAPGIFSTGSDGTGVAAAQAVLVHADQTTAWSPVYQCDAATGDCKALPVDFGAGSDQLFLMLYGTGLRGYTSLADVTCTIGGIPAPVLSVGPEVDFDGLDQVKVQVPAVLKGRGIVEVTLSVDRQRSNTVTVTLE